MQAFQAFLPTACFGHLTHKGQQMGIQGVAGGLGQNVNDKWHECGEVELSGDVIKVILSWQTEARDEAQICRTTAACPEKKDQVYSFQLLHRPV